MSEPNKCVCCVNSWNKRDEDGNEVYECDFENWDYEKCKASGFIPFKDKGSMFITGIDETIQISDTTP